MDPLSIGNTISTGLGMVAKILNMTRDYATSFYKDTSLPEVTSLTRVEPVTVVSKDLLSNPNIRIVLNSLLSMDIGYYLQAINLLTKVKDVEVVRILDKLNPNRDETGFLLDERLSRESFKNINLENFQFRLPTYTFAKESFQPAPEESIQLANFDLRQTCITRELEALRPDIDNYELRKAEVQHKATLLAAERAAYEAMVTKARETVATEAEHENSGGGKAVDLDTLVNLSVGRLIDVKIAYSKDTEERHVTVPIAFRLMVSSVSNDSIIRMLTYKNQDISLGERIHSWRSGRIEFIKDLLFCQDLIDSYKKAAIQDPTNVLSEITRRAANTKRYGALTKNPSLVAASSLFVFSDAIAREVESHLGGKLSNSRVREKAFENTYAMIIVVVSDEWETATFYIRGIASSASFSFKELQGKTSGNGPDISDIMKALTAGQPPSF